MLRFGVGLGLVLGLWFMAAEWTHTWALGWALHRAWGCAECCCGCLGWGLAVLCALLWGEVMVGIVVLASYGLGVAMSLGPCFVLGSSFGCGFGWALVCALGLTLGWALGWALGLAA